MAELTQSYRIQLQATIAADRTGSATQRQTDRHAIVSFSRATAGHTVISTDLRLVMRQVLNTIPPVTKRLKASFVYISSVLCWFKQQRLLRLLVLLYFNALRCKGPDG